MWSGCCKKNVYFDFFLFNIDTESKRAWCGLGVVKKKLKVDPGPGWNGLLGLVKKNWNLKESPNFPNLKPLVGRLRIFLIDHIPRHAWMKSKVKIYAALGLGLDLGRTGVYFEDIRKCKENTHIIHENCLYFLKIIHC